MGYSCFVISGLPGLRYLSKEDERFNELNVVEYATGYLAFWGNRQVWIDDIIKDTKKTEVFPASTCCCFLAGRCSEVRILLFEIAIGKNVKTFPEFYLTTIQN